MKVFLKRAVFVLVKYYFSIEDGIVKNVDFVKGCPGSLSAIKILVEGQSIKGRYR